MRGAPSCCCPIAGQQAPWPAWQERGGLWLCAPRRNYAQKSMDARTFTVKAVAQLASSHLGTTSSSAIRPVRCNATRQRRGWGSATIGPTSPPASDRCGPPRQRWRGSVCPGPASWQHLGWLPRPGTTPTMGTTTLDLSRKTAKERNSDRGCGKASALAGSAMVRDDCSPAAGGPGAQRAAPSPHTPAPVWGSPWRGRSGREFSGKQQRLQMRPHQTGLFLAKSNALTTDGCSRLRAVEQRRGVFVGRSFFGSFVGPCPRSRTPARGASSRHSGLPAPETPSTWRSREPLAVKAASAWQEWKRVFVRQHLTGRERPGARVHSARGPSARVARSLASLGLTVPFCTFHLPDYKETHIQYKNPIMAEVGNAESSLFPGDNHQLGHFCTCSPAHKLPVSFKGGGCPITQSGGAWLSTLACPGRKQTLLRGGGQESDSPGQGLRGRAGF